MRVTLNLALVEAAAVDVAVENTARNRDVRIAEQHPVRRGILVGGAVAAVDVARERAARNSHIRIAPLVQRAVLLHEAAAEYAGAVERAARDGHIRIAHHLRGRIAAGDRAAADPHRERAVLNRNRSASEAVQFAAGQLIAADDESERAVGGIDRDRAGQGAADGAGFDPVAADHALADAAGSDGHFTLLGPREQRVVAEQAAAVHPRSRVLPIGGDIQVAFHRHNGGFVHIRAAERITVFRQNRLHGIAGQHEPVIRFLHVEFAVLDADQQPILADVQLVGFAVQGDREAVVLHAGRQNVLRAVRHRVRVEARQHKVRKVRHAAAGEGQQRAAQRRNIGGQFHRVDRKGSARHSDGAAGHLVERSIAAHGENMAGECETVREAVGAAGKFDCRIRTDRSAVFRQRVEAEEVTVAARNRAADLTGILRIDQDRRFIRPVHPQVAFHNGPGITGSVTGQLDRTVIAESSGSQIVDQLVERTCSTGQVNSDLSGIFNSAGKFDACRSIQRQHTIRRERNRIRIKIQRSTVNRQGRVDRKPAGNSLYLRFSSIGDGKSAKETPANRPEERVLSRDSRRPLKIGITESRLSAIGNIEYATPAQIEIASRAASDQT